MLYFFEELAKWIDEESPVDIIYFDVKKALSKVPHQILLLNLSAHGIGNGIIDRVETWLTARRQRVVIDGGGIQTRNNFSVGYHKDQY